MSKFSSTPRYSKMRLISEDEYNRLKQKIVRDYDPRLTAMASVADTARSAVVPPLDKTNPLALQSKLQQYHHALDTYKTFQDKNHVRAEIYPEFQRALPILRNPLPEINRNGIGNVNEQNLAVDIDDIHQGQDVDAEGVIAENDPASASIGNANIPLETLWTLVLRNIDEKNRSKVKYLIQNIKANPNLLSISPLLEIMYNGKSISGTSYIDLFNWLYSHHSSRLAKSPPKFATEFFNLLTDNFHLDPSSIPKHVMQKIQSGSGIRSLLKPNIPSRYIPKSRLFSVKKSFSKHKSPSATDSFYKSKSYQPPGKKPHILRVY